MDKKLIDTKFAEEQLYLRDSEKEWDLLWNEIKKLQKSNKSKGEWIEEMQQKYKLAKKKCQTKN